MTPRSTLSRLVFDGRLLLSTLLLGVTARVPTSSYRRTVLLNRHLPQVRTPAVKCHLL
jgi:hypothetical protein